MFKLFNLLFIVLFVRRFVTTYVYFEEEFTDGDGYTDRWIESKHMGDEQGNFQLSTGNNFGDIWRDKGLQTTQDSKIYGISTKFTKAFDTQNKTLVIQFQIKIEEPIECGGGYIKILGSDFDQLNFNSHTPYKIMFGPDICGHNKKIVHVLINYKEKYYAIKKDIKCKDDQFSHLYTLIITPNNTYEILIDNEKVKKGNLSNDFDFLLPKKIKDPNSRKPEDWVDEMTIYDSNDVKPIDWDQPKYIRDPMITKPKNYDEDNFGPWQPPLIENPDYKGEWKQKNITNPNYKGPWIQPLIDNPDYQEDPELYRQKDIGGLGFDIWQVVAGSIFDNILVTDDPKYAFHVGQHMWKSAYDDEMKLYKHKKDYERRQKEEFKSFSDPDFKENRESERKNKDIEDKIIDESMIPKRKTEF